MSKCKKGYGEHDFSVINSNTGIKSCCNCGRKEIDKRRKLELVIEERFGGQFTYGNIGMRHQEEEETFYLKKGDRVYIERRKK